MSVNDCTDANRCCRESGGGADPAGTLVNGGSSLGACLKALVLSSFLDCSTGSQNVPPMHALRYTTTSSLLQLLRCVATHNNGQRELSFVTVHFADLGMLAMPLPARYNTT